jgi:hypothetical protein
VLVAGLVNGFEALDGELVQVQPHVLVHGRHLPSSGGLDREEEGGGGLAWGFGGDAALGSRVEVKSGR